MTDNFGVVVEVAGSSLLALLAAVCGCWALVRVLHCLGMRFGQVGFMTRLALLSLAASLVPFAVSKYTNSPPSDACGLAPLRTLVAEMGGNDETETNTFSVTEFRVDSSNREVAFGFAWTDGLFDDLGDYGVDVFMSTNLLSRAWLPITRIYMPWYTNEFETAIDEWDVGYDHRDAFTNSFSRTAFFRFGLQGFVDDSYFPSFEGALDLEVSSVEDMYRWMCLRNICGDSSGLGSRLGEPSNRPDAECDGRHFVFVHGYNVNAQSARGWASEMFKRLWQSGLDSKFTAVDWFGNDSQIWPQVPALGGRSIDYYVNVRHALDTAPALKTACDALVGDKVVLAHSLGNMLVSEAATHYGLVYSKYYMLNAAVPMEAYDEGAVADKMREHGWADVPSVRWAANWYGRIPYENDPRRTLRWRGRFTGIRNAVNCYSPTEDVLANATNNWYGGIWSVQELYKGTASLHFIPGNCEGGWGYNGDHTNLAGLLTEFAKTNDFTDAELVASPIFRKFDNELLHQTNLITIAQTELNKVMGDGIPATSFAAGANEISALGNSGNYNYQGAGNTLNGWPRKNGDVSVWEHSDIKNVAYYYVHALFEKIKNLR